LVLNEDQSYFLNFVGSLVGDGVVVGYCLGLVHLGLGLGVDLLD